MRPPRLAVGWSGLLILVPAMLVTTGASPLPEASTAKAAPPCAGEAPPGTFEDLYGDTGNRFQGAIGFRTREATVSPEAEAGYGIGIDDVVVAWREFTLVEDVVDCTVSGSCATIEFGSTNTFSGNTRVGVTVVDVSPSDNDCDFDGVIDGTRDCDGDSIDDVPVRFTSSQEPAGEIAHLALRGNSTYSGSVAVSATFDVPGVLFVARVGHTNPGITATYVDLDDGSGRVCQNSVDPKQWGLVQTSSTVFLQSADVAVTRTRISDNGDNDGWADDGETIAMQVEVTNRSGAPVSGLTLRATSNDPTVACVTRPFLVFGDLAANETRFSEAEFEFIMSREIGRTDPFADLTATIEISMDADEFQGAIVPQSVTFDLDLDATGGSGPTTFLESFEAAGGEGLGSFVAMEIDRDLNPPDDDLGNSAAGVLNADGHRCQYSDPDWEGSVSYGSSQAAVCHPNPNNSPDRFFWGVVTERAFAGQNALHWGAFLDNSVLYSTPTAQLEAVRLGEPLNLGWDRVCEIDRTVFCRSDQDCPPLGEMPQPCVAATPRLTFKHQINLLDYRTVGAIWGRSADRSAVQAQLADESGAPVAHWIKLYPYVNVYDTQANSNYFNCSFDPIDDGSTEEDFFDPTDPNRSRGPSSTCAPELGFAAQGETTLPFSPSNIGRAADGPGLEGAHGPGTWVEPAFDLTRFRGRRLRLRFLATSLKLGGFITWENAFVFNPDPRDDGWFIDDVRVTDVLATPAVVAADLKDNSGLPGCGLTCSAVTARVRCDEGESGAVPCAATASPGQPVTLDSSPSSVDRCVDGSLQQRFWLDVDRNGSPNALIDLLLRDWTDDETLTIAPSGSSSYLVEVRCATDPACSDVARAVVEVACPTSDSGPGGVAAGDEPFLGRNPPGGRDLLFPSPVRLAWPSAATVDIVRGDLEVLRATGGLSGTLIDCLVDDGTDTADLIEPLRPRPGNAFFYLARSADKCNRGAGGSYGAVGEAQDRDAAIAGDPGRCPD